MKSTFFRATSSTLLLLFLLCRLLSADSMSADEIELFGFTGPLATSLSCDWICVDAAADHFSHATKTFGDELELSADLLRPFSSPTDPLPQILTWNHPRNFVAVYTESPVSFSVNYQDPYGIAPSIGYPRVEYWVEGSSVANTLVLPSISGSLYGANVTLPNGVYQYRYITGNAQLPSEYILETSSFAVAGRPTAPSATEGCDAPSATNGRVTLSWSASGQGTRYRLHVGNNPSSLSVVYEGSDPFYALSSLEWGKTYYWKVEAVNQYGVSSFSPTYSFATLSSLSRAFNYPNPFNPARGEKTYIVFAMALDGSAEISVYSELGDPCWRGTFDGLSAGAQQVSFQGRDDEGNILYNGTYVCRIVKKYIGREEKEICRILVLK